MSGLPLVEEQNVERSLYFIKGDKCYAMHGYPDAGLERQQRALEGWREVSEAEFNEALEALGVGKILPTNQWTTDRPTEPGWYWVENYFLPKEIMAGLMREGLMEAEVLNIYESNDGGLVASVDSGAFDQAVADFDPRTRWAGPIPPPEET